MTLGYYFGSKVKLRVSAASIALLAASTATAAAAQQADLVDATPAGQQSGAGNGDIVVTGERLSQKAAIDAKKNATGVTDVISADDLGKLPDASVADSIARLPGVSVIVNQDTGEGEYVAIRGLAGTYNEYTINGVRVAQTDPDSRDVSLNLLPPNGLAAVTVSKTLTPDMDGDAIAGAIDFRTPTAYDFSKRTVIRAYAAAGYNDRAKSAGEAAGTYQVQGDFATKFDHDRIGLYISADYGINHGNGQETENDGDYQPYKWKANGQEPIDANSLQLPGIDLDYRRIKQTRFGGNFSLDYHGDTTQLYLRGQYARLQLRGTNDTTDFRNRPTDRLVQVNPDETDLAQPEDSITGTGAKGNIYSYTTSQIVDQDGDGVITDADRATSQYWSLDGRSGVWDPETFQFARNEEVIDQNQTLGTIDLGGHSDLGRLHLDYEATYSGGLRESPDDYSISYNCDACTYPLNAAHIQWTSPDPRFPEASLPAYAENVPHDASLLPLDGADLETWRQTDSRIAFNLDAKYDFDGVLDYLKAGVKATRSHRVYNDTPVWSGDFSNTPLDGLSLADSGLVDKEVTSTLNGRYYYGDIYSRSAVIAAINQAVAANPDGLPSAVDLVSDDTRSTERVFAGYALGHFHADALQVVAGARVEHRETHNEFWVDDPDSPGWGTTNRSYTIALPSVTATLRPNDKQVYRAAIWTGYSPPEYSYVSGGESVTRDPGTHEIVSISRGNPDLKPAKSVNFDVSAEYYPDQTSIVSIAGYYKHIRNFIFTNGNEQDADTQNGFIEITQPKNGNDADVYGVELDLVKNFQGLAAPFDGFGFEGNLTLQHSSADPGLDYLPGKKIPLIDAPSSMYNASLTYQKYGFDMKLTYSYRGKYIEDLRDNGVNKWVQHNASLDFHARYNVNKNLSLDFDLGNILDSWKYYTTRGPNPSYQKDYMEPGRTFLWRLSYVL